MGNDSSQEGSLPTTIFQGRAKSCSWGVRRIPKIIQQPPLVPQHSTTLQHLSVCHFQQVMQDLPSLGIFDGTFFQPISMKQQFARANDGHQTHQQLIITVDCLCCRFYLGIKKLATNQIFGKCGLQLAKITFRSSELPRRELRQHVAGKRGTKKREAGWWFQPI